jgi:hypothetical protein
MNDYFFLHSSAPHVGYDIFKIHNMQEHVIRISQFRNPDDPSAVISLKRPVVLLSCPA